MDIAGAISWITNNYGMILAVIGAFALIANATPNETDNKIMKVVNTVVNALGANYNVKGNMNK